MKININKEIERLDRHYQVFISSTYADLKEYRFSALQAILDAECLPLGMEMFPSGSEEQLTYIKRIIDKCDFYLVIVGGRYGSRAASGISFTEEEFRYAKKCNKRIIALVLVDEDYDKELKNQNGEDQISLIKFREMVRKSRIANTFNNPDQLKFEILKSIREVSKAEDPTLGLVSSKEVIDVIGSLSELDEKEKTQYFEAISHLQNLRSDEIAWTHIDNAFESLKHATHSLVYEGKNNLHGAPLLNSLLSFQRFVEEILYIPVRVSLKEIERENSKIVVRTIGDTNGIRLMKNSYWIGNYYGLNLLFKQVMQGSYNKFWRCDNISKAIAEKKFGRGSFSNEQFEKLSRNNNELPYESSLCLPIYNIDNFDNDKPVVRGFLCIDTKEDDQFQHEAILKIANSYCCYLYIFMTARIYFKRAPDELGKVIFGEKIEE